MPRAFRSAGHRTDLFDGTDLCAVRMYRGLGESWRGFAKNAYEGLGSVGLLVFITVFHLVAHIGPWVGLAWIVVAGVRTPATPLLIVAVVAGVVQRVMLAVRFKHTCLLAVLHPLTVAVMSVIQWHSYIKDLRGTRSWRGRLMESSETDAGARDGDGETTGTDVVVLVDEDDNDVGTMEKMAARRRGDAAPGVQRVPVLA